MLGGRGWYGLIEYIKCWSNNCTNTAEIHGKRLHLFRQQPFKFDGLQVLIFKYQIQAGDLTWLQFPSILYCLWMSPISIIFQSFHVCSDLPLTDLLPWGLPESNSTVTDTQVVPSQLAQRPGNALARCQLRYPCIDSGGNPAKCFQEPRCKHCMKCSTFTIGFMMVMVQNLLTPHRLHADQVHLAKLPSSNVPCPSMCPGPKYALKSHAFPCVPFRKNVASGNYEHLWTCEPKSKKRQPFFEQRCKNCFWMQMLLDNCCSICIELSNRSLSG